MACFIQAHAGNTSFSSKVPDTGSHSEGICPPLRSLHQSVEREYQRSAPVVQVSRCILCVPNPATEASAVHASQPRCNSHGFTPRIRTALTEGFSCLFQKVLEWSDSPCLSDQRVVCVQSESLCQLQMCTQSGQHQCLSDLRSAKFWKNRRMVNSSELSPNVNSLDIAIKNSC